MRKVVLFAVATACGGGQAWAAPDCLPALIQNRAKFDLREASSLALLHLIQQSSQSSSGWGANLGVPVDGVPVELGLNNAEEATNSYFDNLSVNWSHERAVSLATQTLSNNAVAAYTACIKGTKPSGPSITVYNATADAVTVQVRWIAAPNAPASADGRVYLDNDALTQFPSRWTNNTTITKVVKRRADQDLRISANIGAESDYVFVASIPKIVWTPPAKPTADKLLFLGLTPGVNAGEISDSSAFKNGTNVIFGYSVKSGPFAGAPLFRGDVQGVNAGMINTSQGEWRGGVTTPFGFAIAVGKQGSKDVPLYVGVGPACAGAVANNPGHQNCQMQLLGYAAAP